MGTSLGIDDLSLEKQAKLLGHTYVKEAAGDSKSGRNSRALKSDQKTKLHTFGVGFYKRRKKKWCG